MTKVQVNILINREVNLEDYLSEDELIAGSPKAENDEEGLDLVTEDDLMQRMADRIDEGGESVDDMFNDCSDYTVTVTIVDDLQNLAEAR